MENKYGSFSAIIRSILTKSGTKLIGNRQQSCRNALNSLIIKIQNGGGRHIQLRKMSISLGHTMGNNCKMAFSLLHVVESVSDHYNFKLHFVVLMILIMDALAGN